MRGEERRKERGRRARYLVVVEHGVPQRIDLFVNTRAHRCLVVVRFMIHHVMKWQQLIHTNADRTIRKDDAGGVVAVHAHHGQLLRLVHGPTGTKSHDSEMRQHLDLGV